MMHFVNDLATLGQRMRHFRTSAGLTLDQLGADVGVAASQLSLMENGKREPRLSLLGTIAERLGIPVSELLEPTAPSERAGLEIELDRAQSSQVYAELGLPVIRAGKGHGRRHPARAGRACTTSWPGARARRSRPPRRRDAPTPSCAR